MSVKYSRWVFVVLFIWSVPLFAQQLDPHVIYEETCSSCHHSHAGEFVSDRLAWKEGIVVSAASGEKVIPFLIAGHGGLSTSEVAALEAHFLAILQSDRLFFRKCRNCHISARQVARSSLIIRNGALESRYSGQDIAGFLNNHGRLDPVEIDIIVDMLKRQLNIPSAH